MTKKKPIDYVNNREFSEAVVQHVIESNQAKAAGKIPPQVSNYIAECFLKIANRLSRRGNFVGYTYREEMVMDAVENCLKAVQNYDVEAATRSGKPNAFAYFTQISWYAFLRRIAKEKKQQEVKMKAFMQTGIEQHIIADTSDAITMYAAQSFLDSLKDKLSEGKEDVTIVQRSIAISRRRVNENDSDLKEFLDD